MGLLDTVIRGATGFLTGGPVGAAIGVGSSLLGGKAGGAADGLLNAVGTVQGARDIAEANNLRRRAVAAAEQDYAARAPARRAALAYLDGAPASRPDLSSLYGANADNPFSAAASVPRPAVAPAIPPTTVGGQGPRMAPAFPSYADQAGIGTTRADIPARKMAAGLESGAARQGLTLVTPDYGARYLKGLRGKAV